MENFLVKPDVVVLCGGLGTRLRSTIGESQKVMAEVGDRPFLDFIIKEFSDQGFKRFILCAGYKAETVEGYYRDRKDSLIIEISRETEPLGTGGAVKNARRLIRTPYFFILNGDSFCPVELLPFLQFHVAKESSVSMVVARVQENRDYGAVVLDKEQRIQGFLEKQSEGNPALVNAGVYCFTKEAFSFMPHEPRFSLERDFFPKLINKKFYGFITDKEFFDIGTPERLSQARQIFKED